MPLRVEKTASGVVDFDGSKVENQNTHFTAKCDGPKCNQPDSACSGILEWDDGKPDTLPDATARILTVADWFGTMKLFFSKRCLADYMLSYTPPMSVREKAAMEMNNSQIKMPGVAMPSVAIPEVGQTVKEEIPA